jgi:hypothetical protein
MKYKLIEGYPEVELGDIISKSPNLDAGKIFTTIASSGLILVPQELGGSYLIEFIVQVTS